MTIINNMSSKKAKPTDCGLNQDDLKKLYKKLDYNADDTQSPGLGKQFKQCEDAEVIAKFTIQTMLHGPIEELEYKGLKDALGNPILKKALEGPTQPLVYDAIEAELQTEFERFVKQRNNNTTPYSEDDISNDYTFIQHALNFLPLVNVKRHVLDNDNKPFIFKIPVYDVNDTKWHIHEFQMKLIDLTPAHHDRINKVYSYAFEPKSEQGSDLPSFLVHSGTMPPAMDGELIQWHSDFCPILEVGGTLWGSGQHEINNWLNAQNRVYMSGVSLGGSLTMMTARNCENPKVLERVTAINPAKLLFPLPWTEKNLPQENQQWQVIKQEGDLLGAIPGYYPKGWDIVEARLSSNSRKNLERTAPLPFNKTLNHSSCFFGYEGGCHYVKRKSKGFIDNIYSSTNTVAENVSNLFITASNLTLNIIFITLNHAARALLYFFTLIKLACQSLFGVTKKPVETPHHYFSQDNKTHHHGSGFFDKNNGHERADAYEKSDDVEFDGGYQAQT